MKTDIDLTEIRDGIGSFDLRVFRSLLRKYALIIAVTGGLLSLILIGIGMFWSLIVAGGLFGIAYYAGNEGTYVVTENKDGVKRER